MSSTSAQIDEANKLAELVSSGKLVAPKLNSGNASASQLTATTPQQPGIDIADDAIVGGSNRESFPVVESREATPVVVNREIAPVIGLGQEHLLKNEFIEPTIKAEAQTAVPDAQKTTAEKNTELLDNTTAAKQTKLPVDDDEQDHKEHKDHKDHKHEEKTAVAKQKEASEKAKAEHKKDVAKAAEKEHKETEKPKVEHKKDAEKEKAKTKKTTVEVVDKKKTKA